MKILRFSNVFHSRRSQSSQENEYSPPPNFYSGNKKDPTLLGFHLVYILTFLQYLIQIAPCVLLIHHC